MSSTSTFWPRARPPGKLRPEVGSPTPPRRGRAPLRHRHKPAQGLTRMALGSIDKADWPLRPHGERRRASASRVMSKGRISRRTGGLLRLLLLAVIAVPTLIVSSPFYTTYASGLPDVTQVTAPIPSDTIIYASDGTSVLADLHLPGYQHYPERLSAMGTNLPDAIIAIEDRNYYKE